jgi:hypothetical protein
LKRIPSITQEEPAQMKTEPHPYAKYLQDKYGTYRRFLASEGLTVIQGHHVEHVRTVALKEWPRKGGYGVMINLSEQSVDDAYVCEIPPGKSLNPQRHSLRNWFILSPGWGYRRSRRKGSGADFRVERRKSIRRSA